ncbi:SRPBCC family protein [Riemerella columbipharyngis]|uniref:Polyketide cyclase / dehydrase and lipid transport n=1 Tax=Riemerella columbipharyngis TaxID=1071918 RepID=A0A1G6YJE6_9FLAO|nr:polyketide cyclase [Riemerella columbipharyngis]SDD90634.1 hypothetical protein SAMN05421544_101187 [Riemerella columbipharyngis]
MRVLKVFTIIGAVLFGLYALAMYFVDESKSFRIEKEIDYPVEKIFPQFDNFQNMVRWNSYLIKKKNVNYQFFTPYQGEGSSVSFGNVKESMGQVYIRYENPMHTIKYDFFFKNNEAPTRIQVKFIPKGNKTLLDWKIETPKIPLLKRYVNLFFVQTFEEEVNKSLTQLSLLLGNKVEQGLSLKNIKTDSIMVEQQNSEILVGINVNAQNKTKDGGLLKSIIEANGKVIDFVTNKLDKTTDEYGVPILIINPNNFKDKELSYFYGVPLSKRVNFSDNEFTYQQLNPSKAFVIYYKGNYDNRMSAIKKLLDKSKKDSLHSGFLQETFIKAPELNKDVFIKLSLPVSP